MLAVATLAFAVPVSTWLLNPDNFPGARPPGDPPPGAVRLGWRLSSPRTFAAVCFAVTALAWLLMANVRRTAAGRAILGVRDNERAAAAYGVDPVRTRLMAFAIAGGLCGLAGGLYAVALRGVGFAGFDPGESVQTFTMVVVGGLGSLGTPSSAPRTCGGPSTSSTAPPSCWPRAPGSSCSCCSSRVGSARW